MHGANFIRYSPRPIADYVRTVNGEAVGPGTHPTLQRNLAAWNVFFLSFPELEKHTDFGGGDALYPHMVETVAPLAVETCAQFAGNTRVGDLAVHLTPDAFVNELRKRPCRDLALTRLFKLDVWLTVMEGRSALFVPDGPGPYPWIPSGVLTRQQDGTRPEISTNILPLAKIFKLRLH